MSDGLDRYRELRDAARTPEPVPPPDAPPPPGAGDAFVIQEHHARRLHWDVRLERDGVLVSWAVPKGLPREPGQIRLAVHTEDHPMEYLTFEGSIPHGEYGGGRMFVWDRGTYETEKWTDTEVVVVFHGTRVQGRHVFFRSSKKDGDGRDWMVRRSDPPADPGREPLPEAIAPMLAVAGELPTDDEHWAFEFKWDGVRAMARVEGGRLQLTARRGNEITASYPELRALGDALGSTELVLDGEIVAMKDGRPSFSALQNRMHVANPAHARRLAESLPVTYLVFDLLHLDGRSCLGLPYAERRALLDGLDLNGPRWQTPPSFPGEGRLVLAAAAQQRLEGVLAKRLTSRYHPGRRSPDWIKVPRVETMEVAIGGWRLGEGKREGVLGSLLLGLPVRGDDGVITGLRYIGQVGTGFDDEALRMVTRLLDGLAARTSAFVTEVPRDKLKGAKWVRPELVGEVVFREWTPDRRLRFPSWRGLRPDKTLDDLPD